MDDIRCMDITITKKKRAWCDVVVHNDNTKDFCTRVRKDSCEDIPVGVRTTVYGYVLRDVSRYGTSFELIILSEEEIRQKKEEAALEWMEILRRKAENELYFYTKAADKVYELVGEKYASEISEIEKECEKKRWISYFRDAVAKGYIYEKAVKTLRDLGCTEFDEEIAEARRKIADEKAERKRARLQEEYETGISYLHLPAPFGFDRKPKRGQLLLYEGRAFEVVSSYYNKSDGYSFGVMCEQWYSVKAKDVSDTAEGKALIAKHEREENIRRMEYEERCARDKLASAIHNTGHLYKPTDKIDLSDIPGDTLCDTMNIYGGGFIVRCSDVFVYLIQNNGADGDDWSQNNVLTGGAGAYAFETDLESVQTEIDSYKAAKAALAG